MNDYITGRHSENTIGNFNRLAAGSCDGDFIQLVIYIRIHSEANFFPFVNLLRLAYHYISACIRQNSDGKDRRNTVQERSINNHVTGRHDKTII